MRNMKNKTVFQPGKMALAVSRGRRKNLLKCFENTDVTSMFLHPFSGKAATGGRPWTAI
jgi:hypothetical protein